MSIVTSARVSRGLGRVAVGTLSATFGMFFAFGVANAEQPDAELSEDPSRQVLEQIMAMMVQKKPRSRRLVQIVLPNLAGYA